MSPRPARSASRRAPRRLVAAAALLATALTAACTPSSADSRPEVSLSSQERSVQLSVGGQPRSYLLQPALGLQRGRPAALVVVLHQEGGTSEGVAAETALQDLRARGATLAYPAGIDHSWDAGACCGPSKRRGANDLAFLDAMLEDVAARTPVDPDRRAMVGYSSGGMLTYRYVCGRPGALDAAVVVSGSLETECGDGITTPDVLAVHGMADGTIGFSEPVFIRALGLAPRAAESTLDLYTRSAGCSERDTRTDAEAEVRHWSGCRGGSVEATLVRDVGHGWVKLDATRRTREFLVSHLLER